jgi:ketosteroid isomerase-like protein
MKSIVLLLLLAGGTLVVAQRAQRASPLRSMVETEFAFARMSEESGIRPSFMTFIADDGILFRPKAVKGKQWMTDNPLPVSNKNPLLKWHPSFADMSRAGDMGYTFGPWEFKTDNKDTEPVAFGHFLTVWKKQADGSWRFAVDLGVSHPKPSIVERPLVLPDNMETLPRGRLVNVKTEAAKLLARDKQLSNVSVTWSAAETFESNAVDDVRVFREGKQVIAGKKLAAAESIIRPNSWTPEFVDVSRSGDLGYSYGTYEIRNGAAVQETGNYLRIWKKQGGVWKIAVDLANPIVDGKN